METVNSLKLEAAIAKALPEYGADCSCCCDHSVDSDNHDHDQDYCTTYALQLAEKAQEKGLTIFEATLDNPSYEYAHTTYYVLGANEDDAVQSFEQALDED